MATPTSDTGGGTPPDEPMGSQSDVARALGESAVAGGLVGFLVAAAAFLAARFARLRKRGARGGR